MLGINAFAALAIGVAFGILFAPQPSCPPPILLPSTKDCPPSQILKNIIPQVSHQTSTEMVSFMFLLTSLAETFLTDALRPTWWGGMGHIGQVEKEINRFENLTIEANPKIICEVGFNAGHSSIIFLARSKATLYSFDILTHPYSKPIVDIFRATWPQRFQMIKGSSFDMVPAFAANGSVKCDIFSVDGDHSYEGALTDYLNAAKTMSQGGVLIADDVSLDPKTTAAQRFPGSSKAFKELVDAGLLVDPQCEEDPAIWGKGWCWAKVDLTRGVQDSKTPPHAQKVAQFVLNEY